MRSKVEGGLVLDSATMRFVARDLLVENEHILALGTPGEFAGVEATAIDATRRLVLPGLVNAHTHGHGFFSKSVGDPWPLELLIAAAPWITAQRTPAIAELSVKVGVAEMLSKGCTACFDLYSDLPAPAPETMTEVRDAYLGLGFQVTLAPMIADIPLYDALPGLREYCHAAGIPEAALGQPGDGAELIAKAMRCIDDVLAGSAVRPALSPAIPLHCSDELLAAMARIVAERGLPVHTHFLESPLQALGWRRRDGGGLAAGLSRRGMLDERFVAAHALWLDDGEIDLLARVGAKIAHNPCSNMRLGTGTAPVRRYLDAGITIGIGTDTCSCSDNLNMFEAMRGAVHASRLRSPFPEAWLRPEDALAAATMGGAAILGRAADIGKLATGYRADMVLLDLEAPHYMPINDSLRQIVLAEDGTGVDRVYLGGREVVRDGKPLNLDLAELRARVEDANRELMERVSPLRQAFERLAPVVLAYRRALLPEALASIARSDPAAKP